MKKVYIKVIILIQLFFLIHNKDQAYLDIHYSKKHEDKTNNLTPFVITLSSDDKIDKVKGVDLVCIIDYSGSMWGSKITYVRESLNTLIEKWMRDDDKLALITFEDKAKVIQDFTQMTEDNKKNTLETIKKLDDPGGCTNILEGIKKGLDLLKNNDYTDGNRIASMILLSDGDDNYSTKEELITTFKDLAKNEIFTLHTFGYGKDHDSELMNNLSKVKDGGYYFIEKLTLIEETLSVLFGLLSTTYKVNVKIEINSIYPIKKIYGIEDFYNSSPEKEKDLLNSFSATIIHFKYGKKYHFISLIDAPSYIKEGTEILSVNIPSLDLNKKYLWKNNDYHSFAYEEYVRGISFELFQKSYDLQEKNKHGIELIKNGIFWIKTQYILFDGVNDEKWVKIYENIIEDLNNFTPSGKANILSKLRELKTEKPGIHFKDYNSYEEKIVNNLHSLDKIKALKSKTISKEEIIPYDNNVYNYFYLKSGIGEINGLRFSGEHSSIVLYAKKVEINPISKSLEYYNWSENLKRIQTEIDLNKGGKFMFNNDFPFQFYTLVDGNKDIVFNIQFTELQSKITSDKEKPEFQIEAYVLDEITVNDFVSKEIQLGNYYYPTEPIKTGYFDYGLKIGKISLKKEEILKSYRNSYKNYLYIHISKKKSDGNVIEYEHVEGQFSFLSIDTSSPSELPENFYIFNNLNEGQTEPHLYKVEMDKKKIRIEFATSGNELDCKILKNKKYDSKSDELYVDYQEYKNNINRINGMGKQYIDITQSVTEEEQFDSVIISIFSKNGNHIAGNEISKLSYVVRYSKYTNYGIYEFNDSKNLNGEITIKPDEDNNKNYIISFNKLKSRKNENQFEEENTNFILKLYPLNRRIKIYNTISIFEDKEKIFYEGEKLSFTINSDDINENENYYFTLLTISKKNNEIISYNNIYNKINRTIEEEILIDDYNSYENELYEEYKGEKKLKFSLGYELEKKFLQVKISDFEEGKYGYLFVTIGGKTYKSTQHLDHNIVIIPKEKVEDEIEVEIALKDGENTNYYFSIQFTDCININVGESLFFEMFEEYKNKAMIILNSNNKKEQNINVFAQSKNGDVEVISFSSGTYFVRSEFFGAMSANFLASKNNNNIEIRAKTGDIISLYSHFIDNPKKKIPHDYDININGYLQQKDCIYFDDFNIEKYQIRILGDKKISIKYNNETKYSDTEPQILYLNVINNQKLNKICLKPKDDLESVFFNIQILDISKQAKCPILQPLVLDAIYQDKLSKNEIRYYKQGLFEPNQNSELKYIYNVHQIEGKINVYVTKCSTYPNCDFTKEKLEKDENAISLYNINGLFVHSIHSDEYQTNDSENVFIYVILCLTDSCKYKFILNKSTSIINLSELGKFTSKINKNQIDKFSISEKKNIKKITITLYTFSGEVMLRTNDKCEKISHIIFGHMEKMEIPKEEIDHSFELFVQANMDSVYTIEYMESIDDFSSVGIKSNIENIVNINQKTLIRFSPLTDLYTIKFVPINCEIKVRDENESYLNSENNIFYYISNSDEKFKNFVILPEKEDCLLYLYLEEFTENSYPILSDKVPYYLTLNSKITKYQLVYPLPNSNYNPMYRVNFFEEFPIRIINKINNNMDNEINAIFMKDIKPSSNLLKNCDKDGICYLLLEINYNKALDGPLTLEIIPKSSNNVPSVLRSNQMRQDFIGIKGNQKYMAKILENEEGEVYFNYKFYSGELIAKLIVTDKKSWKNKYDLPERNEQLRYDNLKQKIVFTKKETAICKNGCYLFIEVNCLESFQETKYSEGVNMDYSIYFKQYDIVQLRLNEITYGTLSKTINDNNYMRYYSIEIPSSADKIFIDFNSDNAKVLVKYGNTKPRIYDKDYSFEKGKTFIVEKNQLEKKITIGIYTDKLENKVSQYNLRIRVENKFIKNYIYSDTNNENTCETKEDNQYCYFIIPIINVQQYANLFLYALSNESENLIISYKKINLEIDNNDNNDEYTKNSEGQFIQNMLIIKNNELNLNENDNILIRIKSPKKGIITLLYTFKSYLKDCLLNPNNKVVYSMNPNEELYLDMPDGLKSLVQINVIDGKGYIGYEDDKNILQELSGKYSSICLQSDENDENKKIKIKTDSENSFYFYTSLKINSNKRNINVISKGSFSLKTIKGFPIEFYSQISENKDYTINFNINNIKKNQNENLNLCDFSIKAYIVSEDIIDLLTNDDSYVYIGEPFKGKYESGLDISKLDLSKEDIKKYYKSNKINYVYIIVEASNNNPFILNQIYGEISILENNNLDIIAPDNVYINGNLKSDQNHINKYKLIKKNIKDKKIRVEFSSSSESVKYRINPETIIATETSYLGKKNIDINVEEISDPIIFEIYAENKEEDKNKLSYSFRYRTDEGIKTFKNYETFGNTKGKFTLANKTKIQDKNMTSVQLSIPSILESNNIRNLLENENNSPNYYYLKIYTCSEKEKELNNSNTISIIEGGMELNKAYEFTFNENIHNKTIDIPLDKNIYITIKAVTPDKELLSYDSLFIDKEQKEENNENENENKNKNEPTDTIVNRSNVHFYSIIILLTSIIIILIMIIFICFIKKKRTKNKDIDLQKDELYGMMPLSGDDK